MRIPPTHLWRVDSNPSSVRIEDIGSAIDEVFDSYKSGISEVDPKNQVLIQPMLENTTMSGVAFSRDPSTNAPYFIINYESAGDTEAVTSGQDGTKVYIAARGYSGCTESSISKVIALIREVEAILELESLDIEFALDKEERLYLLQARPLVLQKPSSALSDEDHYELLNTVKKKLK